jgi:hypothetical protein
MGVAAAIAIGIGTAVSVKGQLDSAKAQRKAGRQRRDELRRAAEVERERGRRLRSAQRARFGAAGVGLAGTPLLVGGQALVDSLLDQEAILAGARNAGREGSLRADAATIGAIGSGISGLGQALFTADQAGLFGGGSDDIGAIGGGLAARAAGAIGG